MGTIQINKLNPHPKNDFYFTDLSGEKYEEVKNSIAVDGIRENIIITPAHTIISGHQRHIIANDLGLSTVPVEIKDVDEWEAEYLLIAYNTERRGESESDPVKKGRIAAFLKDYWGVRNGGNGNNQYSQQTGQNADLHSMKDVAEYIGEDERTTRRLIKLNDLIPELQSLVSSRKLGTTAAEQLAYLTEEEQTSLFEERGESIGEMTVEEVKQLRKEVEDLRKENEQLKSENNDLKEKMDSMIPAVVTNTVTVTPEHVQNELQELKVKIELSSEQQSKLKQKLKDAEDERDRYIEQARLLEKQKEDGEFNASEEYYSPETKMFMKKRVKIQEISYELIDQIRFLAITPPLDAPDMYVSDMLMAFDEIEKEIGKIKMKMSGTNDRKFINAEYKIIDNEKGEIE